MTGGLPAKRRHQAVLAVVGAGIGVAATAIVIQGIDLKRTLEIVAGAQPQLLAGAIGLIAVQATLRAIRWKALLPVRANGSRASLARVLPAMLIGYLGNAVLPARLGEVLRSAVVARREGFAASEALGSAVLERVLDVLVLALLGLLAVAGLVVPGWMTATAVAAFAVATAALVILGMGAFITLRHHARGEDHGNAGGGGKGAWIRVTIARLVTGLTRGARVVDRPWAIAFAVGLTLVAWLIDASIFWLAARALGYELWPAGALLVSVAAVLSTAIPTAPGYVGTFELAAVAALSVSGIEGEAALAVALVAHGIAVIPLSLAGALSLWVVGGQWARTRDAAARTHAQIGGS